MYPRAVTVGAASALAAVLVWVAAAALLSFLKWQRYLGGEADFGGGNVLTLGPGAVLVALAGFIAGFAWSLKRSRRLSRG
jgi:hypothetical protein